MQQRQQHMGDARLELKDGLDEALRPRVEIQPSPAQASAPFPRAFKLTTEVCRSIDRESLDPAMIGDELEYLDNETPSDTLVLYLPGFGLGHTTFAEVLSRSPYRGVAVTLYGFEESRRHRIPLPMTAHLKILRALLENLNRTIEPARVILTGFSNGDLVMIGTTLAHYRITAALGSGGMGEVWRAEDTNTWMAEEAIRQAW